MFTNFTGLLASINTVFLLLVKVVVNPSTEDRLYSYALKESFKIVGLYYANNSKIFLRQHYFSI